MKVKEKVKENEKEKEKEKEEEEDVISTDDFVSSSKNVKSVEKVERASQMLSDAIFEVVTDEGKLTAQAQQEFFQLHDSRSDLCFFHLFLFIFLTFFLMFKNITVRIAYFLYVSIFCHFFHSLNLCLLCLFFFIPPIYSEYIVFDLIYSYYRSFNIRISRD